MLKSTDWSVLWTPPAGAALADALILTIEIATSAWVISMIVGIAIGLFRDAPSRGVQIAATVYVEIFRNIPLLVQLFFVYFIFPRILPRSVATILFDWGWEVVSSVIALSLYSSAKIAELVRSGYRTIGPTLRQAAAASGLTWWQAERHVFLELLLRTIAPGLTSEFITIFKGSSLAIAVGVAETTYVSRQLGTETFQWLATHVYATLVYLLVAWAISGLMLLLEPRLSVVGRVGR